MFAGKRKTQGKAFVSFLRSLSTTALTSEEGLVDPMYKFSP